MEERVLKPTDIVISQTDIEGNIIYLIGYSVEFLDWEETYWLVKKP